VVKRNIALIISSIISVLILALIGYKVVYPLYNYFKYQNYNGYFKYYKKPLPPPHSFQIDVRDGICRSEVTDNKIDLQKVDVIECLSLDSYSTERNDPKLLENLYLYKNLRILDYYSDQDFFPPQIKNLTNLTGLYYYGHLKSFPQEILRLSKLKYLEIGGYPIQPIGSARFTYVPPEIANLKNLEQLSFVGVEGVQLPDEISQLNLNYLDLENTKLPVKERKRIIKLLPKTFINFATIFN
jgi:hypothetical protein